MRGISCVLCVAVADVQQSPGLGLRGRRTELAALDRLLAEVQAGQSRVLVLRGEVGVGKTVLLDYLQERA
jgi:predicted ATPase